VRSDAKASTAGSTTRRLALPVAALAALLAALVLVSSAAATKTHIFKEVFGSSAQPTFSSPRGMAIDQGSGDVYVIDAGTPPSVKRYSSDGTAHSFSALASNAIDGKEGADATPQAGLSFGAANRVQIAIDESGTATDGDIYVAQQSAKVLDVFDQTGTYKGQLTESSEGLLGEICGVAVDAAGAIYLGDIAGKIHKYVPAANPPANGDNTANFATVAAPCQIAAGSAATAGFIFVNRSNGELLKVDAATGESKYQLGAVTHRTVYVNPATGHVYAPRQTGSSSEVVEYDASGAGSATTVSSLKPGSTIEGVAVKESNADVYLTRSGQTQAQVYGPTVTQPDVTTAAATNNTGARATLNGSVNPDGVELSECLFEWGVGSAFDKVAPCAESNATIGSGSAPAAVHADISGLIPNGTQYRFRLLAKNPATPAVKGSEQSFNTPNTVTAGAASAITPTTATLNGSVNPDGEALSGCAFEWGPLKTPTESFQHYPNSAPCVPGPGGIGTGTSPVAVSAALAGLEVGTTYVYRLAVTYPGGTVRHPGGTPLSLLTAGPVIAGVWSEDVLRTEAALKAQINPEGSATTYRFEWGTSEAYGEETEELNVGSDSSVHELTRFLAGLSPDTTYHYRAIATNADAENVGPDRTFTTYAPPALKTDCPNQVNRYGASAKLPGCRAYEMVSPVDKAGADIVPYAAQFASDQASLDGDKMAYTVYKPFGDALASLVDTSYIASRGAAGWSSHSITPKHEQNQKVGADPIRSPGRYSAFSEDLSLGFLYDDAKPPLTEDAIPDQRNYYLRDNDTDTYTALTKQVFSTPRSDFGGMGLQGYSADYSHTIFAARAQFTPDAAPGQTYQLYDYHDGELELASVLPGGEPAEEALAGGAKGAGGGFTPGAGLNYEGTQYEHAISDDGSRIFWTDHVSQFAATGEIYARIDGETTIPVSAAVSPAGKAYYWTAAADGSQVIFTANGTDFEGGGLGSLYRFDVDTETPTPIASEVMTSTGVLGASEDAAKVYFISREALAAGAVAGEPNLYLDDEGAKTLIATLAGGDEGSGDFGAFFGAISPGDWIIQTDFSRVSADGEHLVFQSLAPLTGYDNTSADTGKPAEEIYAYDAESEELDCISCNPSGARPQTSVLTAPHRGDEDDPIGGASGATDAAAWLPTPHRPTHIPRMIAPDGSYVFFNAHDALVPEDVNNAQDVYLWVEQGVEGCKEADGCVSLISTGTNPERSTFLDASGDGKDVFFRTKASIVPEDEGLIDIYDARVGGGFPPSASAPECEGDACRAVPEAPRFPNTASSSFRGAGNPVPLRDCTPAARRAAKLSRLARALRRRAEQASDPKQASALRRRSARYAKRAKGLGKRASRCRRANRRAGR